MARNPNKPKRFAQIREAYTITREQDKRIGFILAGLFLGSWILFIGLGFLWGHPIYVAVLSLPLAILLTTFVFSRRAERAAYDSIQGQSGAAASVLMAIRRGWTVDAAVNVSASMRTQKNPNMIHRAVGRAGVVLVAEGTQNLRAMMLDEKRKTERYVPGTPITEIYVGDGEGFVSIRKLQKELRKLPKVLTPTQMREVRNRLKSVGGMNIPIPKGPMPNRARMPRPR